MTTLIQALGVNAVVICDCKAMDFRVGVFTDGQDNYIRAIECTACGKQMAIPFQAAHPGRGVRLPAGSMTLVP